MESIAAPHPAVRLWDAVLQRLAQRMAARGAHPARTVVLLPYAQLMPLVRRLWARAHPDGFAPRFETSMNWSREALFEPAGLNLSMDVARDLLVAREWLERAGLRRGADALAGRLVEAAWQAADAARAVPPGQRADWAARIRPQLLLGLEAPALETEARIASAAFEWAAASAYATDGLLDGTLTQEVDLLVVLQGYQPDPFAAALAATLGERAEVWTQEAPGAPGQLALHAAADAAEEAERAAACVLRHLEAGRTPVAVAATDRVLTRRVGALLAARDVPVRDATGWRLSTTRLAAGLMGALRACAWDAPCDMVLDWLKNAPACTTGRLQALERRVRRAGVREWRMLGPRDWGDAEGVRALADQVAAWREDLQEPRELPRWIAAFRGLLAQTGQSTLLQADAAGRRAADALRLQDEGAGELAALPQAKRRLDLRDFTAWVNEVLEATSFVPPHEGDEPVVFLPLAQVLGAPFAALVLPGCDERNLPASPDPAAGWTAAQRRLLGLPERDVLAAAQEAAWRSALQVPHCDLLWRGSDDAGEPVLASPLVQALRLEGAVPLADDPRTARPLAIEEVVRPQPQAGALVPAEISPSSYEDLRRCPYRFFATRMLGLREADEMESEVDKRDFGTWLHAVLTAFHEELAQRGGPGAREQREALLEEIAQRKMAALRMAEGEFLPFAAGWPQLKRAYLDWLDKRDASGARFAEAETQKELQLGPWKLVGRVDRIDREGDGTPCVLDYKTEGVQATQDRMKTPLEDTQLAFYAALLGGEGVRAAYLNLSERGKVTEVPHGQVELAAHLLKEGLATELRRIAQGAPLPALGEGRACEFCGARGLCRKDGWHG